MTIYENTIWNKVLETLIREHKTTETSILGSMISVPNKALIDQLIGSKLNKYHFNIPISGSECVAEFSHVKTTPEAIKSLDLKAIVKTTEVPIQLIFDGVGGVKINQIKSTIIFRGITKALAWIMEPKFWHIRKKDHPYQDLIQLISNGNKLNYEDYNDDNTIFGFEIMSLHSRRQPRIFDEIYEEPLNALKSVCEQLCNKYEEFQAAFKSRLTTMITEDSDLEMVD